MKIKPGVSLVSVVVCLWINLAAGQIGEFEGSATSSQGGTNRLVDFDSNREALTLQTDDCRSKNVPGVGINFKGETFYKIHICANGMLRFKDATYQQWPRNFGIVGQDTQREDACLMPYWSRVDNQSFVNGDSKVYYKQYTRKWNAPAVFTTAENYANNVLKRNHFSPEWVIVVTWKDLRPATPGNFAGRNTFQCLITSDNTVSIAVYIYADIDWSVRALKIDQSKFGKTFPPVVGWNAGARHGSYTDGKEYENFKHSGNYLIEEIDDEPSNPSDLSNPKGIFGFELGGGEEPEPSPLAKCITWSLKERLLPRLSCIHRCPPSIAFISRYSYHFRFRVYFENRRTSICFISGYATRRAPTATRCCYRNNFRGSLIRRGPNSGSVLRYHPFLFPSENAEEKEAYENCCEKTNFCGFYFGVRRRCVRGWRRSVWGFLFGDPHFRTLDGKNYTFNGCGWYTYFKGNISNVTSSSLVVQVRTTKVGDANATGFTGIVLKEGVSETVQVNLRSTGGFLVLINGSEYTEAITVNGTTLPEGVTLSVVENKTLSIGTPLGNGVRITDTANGTFFTFVTSFIQDYKNSSSGLCGKWNDNMDDDFTLPDGKTLSIDLSDSQIHYDFGEKWRVESNETLYTNVPDDVNFVCPETFVPIFLDQALQFTNSTLRQEADRICGNDVNCLFDIAATGNPAIGESTISQIVAVDKEIEELENNFPYFTDNITKLNVTLGETFTIELNAVDADGDTLSFHVDGLPVGANYTSIGNVLSFSWLVKSTDSVNLTFTVEDTKNGTESFNPDIDVCACQNGANCFIPEATSDATEQIVLDFVVMECKCPLGKIGRFCGSQKDFCESGAGTVCHPLVTCTNNPTSFACGPCPTGYTGNGHVCTDIDECIDNNGGCGQLCANAAPLFSCGCKGGYTLNSDKRTCNDVDECSRPNHCSQLCNNTDGDFQCYCRIGFEIDPVQPNNCKATNLCEPARNECGQICYMDQLNPGQAKCDCNSGYILDADQKTCRDVDECVSTETNLCDQICTNTISSYNCSCKDGFEATGPYTCGDIDECERGEFTCDGSGEICENLIGTHRCICNEQWNLIRVNGSCALDPNAVADPPPEPRDATVGERRNSIRLKILDFQTVNWTVKEDDLFRSSVITLINEFCNENSLRPQDCGVSQNQLLFNLFHLQRIPGFPKNNGSDAVIEFYVVYPNNTTPGPVPRSTLASIINAQIEKLGNSTKLNLLLETKVTPDAPKIPSAEETANSVTVQIINFKTNQWTTFYDTVFRRAVSIVLNGYCNRDAYSLENDCQLISGSPAAFNLTHIGRRPGFPSGNGENVDVSFYVNYPNGTAIPQIILASILTTQRKVLESSLQQQVRVVTSAAPSAPPIATTAQTSNSIVLQILDFQEQYWTYLNDKRLRKSIASRLASYCGRSTTRLADCKITGNQASFTILDVERTTSGTPTQNGDNADFSFYLKYPGGSSPMAQSILASVVKTELDALQVESGFTLTLQTSFQPPAPSPPSTTQSDNSVEIEILNLQADQWTAIQDNRLRAAIAAQLMNYCTNNLLACNVLGNQVSFSSSHVTRIAAYPSQNGTNATYKFFVDIPNGSGPLPKNLLAGILLNQLTAIQNASDSQFSVQTSPLASPPPPADSSKTDEAVTVRISNLQADQWSAIQDNLFRGSVAKTSTDYCQLSDVRRQECRISEQPQTTFTISNVQRIPNSPSQNESNSDLTFYVVYPSGNPVSQRILALIIQEQLDSLQDSTGLQLTLRTTFAPPPSPAPPTLLQNRSSIEVVINNYNVSQWPIRDPIFRQNMAAQLIQFCNTSTTHFDLCNISRNDLFSLNSSHVQLLPGSPTQDGSDAVLAFFVNLPSGTGTVARNILASVFVSQRNEIISLQTTVMTSPLPEEVVLTLQQQQNLVPITIFDYSMDKFTSLDVLDIKITIAARMNNYCFRDGSSENTCGLSQRRKKRDTTNQNKFTQDDVHVIQNSLIAVQNNTVLNISVTYPGQNTPVSSNIVQDALYKSFQDTTSNINNLKLGIVNIPTVTASQTASVIEVRLPNFSANQWSLSKDISFRHNMSKAIIGFCNETVYNLELCNISRDELSKLSFISVQPLPNSPRQNGNDALLSFYVNLPSGGGTIPQHVLATIFAFKKDEILSQPSSLQTSGLPNDSSTPPPQGQELIEVNIENNPKLTLLHLLDIQHTVADRMNQYCGLNSSNSPCEMFNGSFTSKDVHVFVRNGTAQFYVTYPGTKSPVSTTIVRDAVTASSAPSKILGLTFSVDPSPVPTAKGDDAGVDWPLILGLSIGGAFLLIFVVLSIIIGVLRGDKDNFKPRGDHSEARSVYTSRGWEFDRASPYSGSPFASIDAIPGFDEDGLPSENPVRGTYIY